ncbi:hypothetical protein BDV12DRAFT_200563 [Aspergillus spectabilis]
MSLHPPPLPAWASHTPHIKSDKKAHQIQNRPSPMHTRKTLKSHPSAQGSMSIETYLTRLDPYRTSSNTWPYPWSTAPACKSVTARVEEVREGILRILGRYGFPSEQFLRISVEDVARRFYPRIDANGDLDGDNRRVRTTVRMMYITNPDLDTAPATPNDLKPARLDIDTLLLEHNLENIYSEICFLNQSFTPVITHLEPPDMPEQFLKKEVRRAISNILHRHLGPGNNPGPQWCVSVMEIGETWESLRTCLGVWVEPGSWADWGMLRVEVEGAFEGEKVRSEDGEGGRVEGEVEVDVDVEFFPGRGGGEFGVGRRGVFGVGVGQGGDGMDGMDGWDISEGDDVVSDAGAVAENDGDSDAGAMHSSGGEGGHGEEASDTFEGDVAEGYDGLERGCVSGADGAQSSVSEICQG